MLTRRRRHDDMAGLSSPRHVGTRETQICSFQEEEFFISLLKSIKLHRTIEIIICDVSQLLGHRVLCYTPLLHSLDTEYMCKYSGSPEQKKEEVKNKRFEVKTT